MELIDFEDDILVERATGEKEPVHGELITEEVYNDKGKYQQGGPTYTNILTTNSVLFLQGDVFLKENDIVFVTLHNAVKKRAIVGTPRYIKMPITGERYSRFVLKQVQDID